MRTDEKSSLKKKYNINYYIKDIYDTILDCDYEGMIDIKTVAQTCAEDYWYNHDGWDNSERCCYTVIFTDPQDKDVWYECDVELEPIMSFNPSSIRRITKAEAIGAEDDS